MDVKKLAHREYRKRHDKVALRVHWEVCKYRIECNDKWYDHQLLPVLKNGNVKITCDSTFYTDKKLKHNRPDITLVDKDTGINTYRHGCTSGQERHHD